MPDEGTENIELGGINMAIKFDIPTDTPPPWLPSIGMMGTHHTYQTSSFAGARLPEQQPPGPTRTYVQAIPQFHNIGVEQPEQAPAEAASPPTSESAHSEPVQTPQTVSAPEEVSQQGPAEEQVTAPAPSEAPSEPPSGGEDVPSGESVVGVEQPTPEPQPEHVQTPESLPTNETPTESPESPSAQPEPSSEPEAQPQPDLPTPAKTEDVLPSPALQPNPPQMDFPNLTEAVWFAGIAFCGQTVAKVGVVPPKESPTGPVAPPQYTFWDGFHQDGGINFGYDETAVVVTVPIDPNPGKDDPPEPINNSSAGLDALVGMDINQAFAVSNWGYGNVNGFAPSSFTGSGLDGVTLDLTKNDQAPPKFDGSYKPSRSGDGPLEIPIEGVAAIAVISMPSSGDPGSIELPPAWWIMSSRLQGAVVGLICAGVVPPNATTITFGGKGNFCVSMMVLINCAGSIVPKQILTFSGTVDHSDKPTPIDLSVTPMLPAPWPPTKVAQVQIYADVDPKSLPPPFKPPPASGGNLGDPIPDWPPAEMPAEGAFAIVHVSQSQAQAAALGGGRIDPTPIARAGGGGGCVVGCDNTAFPCVTYIPYASNELVVIGSVDLTTEITAVGLTIDSIEYFVGNCGVVYASSSEGEGHGAFYDAFCNLKGSFVQHRTSVFNTDPPPVFTHSLMLEGTAVEGGGSAKATVISGVGIASGSNTFTETVTGDLDWPVEDGPHTSDSGVQYCGISSAKHEGAKIPPGPVDWVGWFVGMEHADPRDKRRIVWPQNPGELQIEIP